MTLFFSFVVATFVTMVLIPPLARLASRLNATDWPGERKVHAVPMPRLGGLAMAIGSVLPIGMWAPLDRQAVAYLCGVAIIVFFGVWDDVRRLDYRLKFLGQTAAVLVAMLYGGIVIRYLPFGAMTPLPSYVSLPLTLFALVGVTNAINLADGLDGLAGGIALLSLAAIAVVAYASTDGAFVLLAAVSVIGSVLGFLRFNTYPARIFMGDGGSQFLGFTMGLLVVVLTQQANTAVSPAIPLLILGLPIVDTLLVIGERMYQGRSPFVADRKHVHHRLLALGFDHYEAVVAIYAVQSTFILCAYFLRFESDALIMSVYALLFAGVIAFLKTTSARRWSLHGHSKPRRAPAIPRWIAWLRQDQRILKGAFYAAIVAIPAFFFAGTVFASTVPKDIGALASILLVVLVAFYFRYRHRPFSVFEKASAYVAGICVVYLVQVDPASLAALDVCWLVLFVTMTLAVVIGFRVGRERFRITPMDFLVVFMALVVPNLPELKPELHHVGIGVAMIIVLLYSIELVLNSLWRRWDIMRFTTYATLAVLGLRGLGGA